MSCACSSKRKKEQLHVVDTEKGVYRFLHDLVLAGRSLRLGDADELFPDDASSDRCSCHPAVGSSETHLSPSTNCLLMLRVELRESIELEARYRPSQTRRYCMNCLVLALRCELGE